MKKSILLILVVLVFISCEHKNFSDLSICDWKTEIKPPIGYEVNSIGEINFNGSVQAFQFLDEETGYAMLNKNAGGYVEVFKTIDGGQTWTNLQIGINQYPKSMIFRDENFGVISVQDVTGCPPPYCEHKCVILKTENGGVDWEEIELEDLKGVLYDPKYDSQGNLYANLKLNGKSTLMKSIDNGANWDTLYSSADLGFSLSTYSFELYDDKLFTSTQDGKIYVISTNGQLLKTIDVENSSIWDLEIIDENNLIVVLTERVIKSTNGGDTWQTIYSDHARMIGFESVNKGLMLLQKNYCPEDVYQANDLIASTNNGGLNWLEAEETTTNMAINFSNSQKVGDGVWYMMIGNKLIGIKER